MVRQVIVTEEIARYAVRLVAASRPGQEGTPDFVNKYVKWGAGLRASQALILGGKARALMNGRYHVSVKDIQALAAPILRHRIITNFYAESEHLNSGRHRRRGCSRPCPCRRAACDGCTSRRARASSGFSTPPSWRGSGRSS